MGVWNSGDEPPQGMVSVGIMYNKTTKQGIYNETWYNPINATAAMTQPVGVDSDGQLWTSPTGSGELQIPTIAVSVSQVISEDPITIQFTSEQAAIIEDVSSNPFIKFDVTALGMGATVVRNSVDSSHHYLEVTTFKAPRGVRVFYIRYDEETLQGVYKEIHIDPDEVTEDMTQPVGIDEDGELWTKPAESEVWISKSEDDPPDGNQKIWIIDDEETSGAVIPDISVERISGGVKITADSISGETEAVVNDGKNLTILGYYGTFSQLVTAVPDPNAGDAYGVGASAPFDLYVWDTVTEMWRNNGSIGGGGGFEIPTITITDDQIGFDDDPITIQFTSEQQAIIDSDDNPLLILDIPVMEMYFLVQNQPNDSDVRLLIYYTMNPWSNGEDAWLKGVVTMSFVYYRETGIGEFNEWKIDPEEKTNDMTQEVGLDDYGYLWTKPGNMSGITDSAGYYTATTVEGALQELGALLSGLESALDAINDTLEGSM